MKRIVVGTAGHIDHGKSALVKALTGTDPDRWEEEKRRGITIDIGFAHLDLPGATAADLVRIAFVDVPGHERFVKNMLAGVAGIDMVLFVVAADESIKPQTREHFDICRLLDVRSGVVALTKSDTVDADLLDLVRMEVEEFVAGSFLAGAPVVPVSAKTGAGLDRLIAELRTLAAATPERDTSSYFRLPIDRAFVMKGFGAVVTGTLIAGGVEKEAEVELMPSGRRVRVRGIQVHNTPADRAVAGERTALNLAGVDASEIERGMALAAPGVFQTTDRVETVLHLLRSARALENRAQVHFHAGTASIVAEVRLGAAQEKLRPGESAYAQFLLREPALLLPGDRFIVRQFSPVVTIGGGRVLDNRPVRRSARHDPKPFLHTLETGSREDVLAALVERAGPAIALPALIAQTGWLESEIRALAAKLRSAGRVEIVSEAPLAVSHGPQFRALLEAALNAVREFHRANPLVAGMAKEQLREQVFRGAPPAVFEHALSIAVRARRLDLDGEIVREAGRQIVLKEDEERARRDIEAAFQAAGLTVPAVKDVLGKLPVESQRSQKILQMLVRDKVLVKVADDLVFHRDAIGDLRARLARYKKKQSDRLNVTAFKDLAGITRKYAIPLLEYLDRERVTRRAGDERIIL